MIQLPTAPVSVISMITSPRIPASQIHFDARDMAKNDKLMMAAANMETSDLYAPISKL